MATKRVSRPDTERKPKLSGHFFRVFTCSLRCLQPRRCLRRCLISEGQTLVETALSLSILFAMVFGIIQVGLALYTYDFVAESAREGSRYAMVRGSSCTSPCTVATSSSVQSYVQSLGYPGLNSSNLTVTTTWPDTGATCTPSVTPCNNPGNNVKVKAKYVFPWNIPFVPSGSITMTSTSEVVISQ